MKTLSRLRARFSGSWTVTLALITNLGITGLKAWTGYKTGSASLMSEAAHSLIDSLTEVLLLVGIWHGRKWSVARYFWGLLASINMFFVGGVWACWEGLGVIVKGSETGPLSSLLSGIAVLVFSAGLESTSWLRAAKELAQEKTTGTSWIKLLRTTTNTEAKTVLEEDTADITGCCLSGIGIALWAVTGYAGWDGVASILIGLMLIVMAYELGSQNVKLLMTTRKEEVYA
jgi:divalent metal cation (Fe/Co/Zn/Cd) transporter